MKFIKKYLHQILIFALVLIIFITNYQSGTSLIGWDNFNSELNPWLAVTQAFNSAWSNFRSFGFPAGLAYATDLWHALFVWFLSFFLPQNVIRYVFHCFILFTGGVGLYSLFKYFNFAPKLSLLGALFYILNFGTIQIFGLPYEPFSIFFGLLPWAILSIFEIFTEINRRHLIRFFVINLFLSGAFYVQTIFIVYGLIFSTLSLVYLFDQNFTHRLKKIIVAGILILLINSYWLFNQVYFLSSGAVNVVQQAAQTQLGWDIPFYQNKVHSNLWDFFTQKGYYSDFGNSSGASYFVPWLDHFKSKPIIIFQFFIIFVIINGLLDGKNKFKKYFIPLLILHAISLLMDIPLFKQINDLIRQIPIIDQILRSPFSKFTMSLSLVFSYFFITGLQNLPKQKILRPLFIGILLIIFFPVLQGNFFAKEMKVKIPSEYFQIFDYFKKQNQSERLALFPETNIWGWYSYDWGYDGSGFLWHSIEQPIIARSYDVWSKNSENYYFDILNALATENNELIESVFTKYQVSYILIDKSLINGSPKARFHQLNTLQKYLDSSPNYLPALSTNNITLFKRQSAFSDFSTSNILPSADTNIDLNTLPKIKIDFENYTDFSNCGSHQDLQKPSDFIIQKKSNSTKVILKNYASACWGFHYDNLNRSANYLLHIPHQNLEGAAPRITVIDHTHSINIIEKQLNSKTDEFLYIPAGSPYQLGLSVNFQIQSFPGTTSINTVSPPELYSIPPIQPTVTNLQSDPFSSNFSLPWLHIVSPKKSKYLFFSQSYDSGWLAISNGKILPHLLVNNWANGWLVSPELSSKGGDTTIYILFWPQLLEFIGFGLLLGTFIYIIRKK